MSDHRYILEPYKGINTRYQCPNLECKGKNFVRYIDTETGEHLHPKVGRCNHENHCGYHYTPKQYFQDNNLSFDDFRPQPHLGPEAITTQQKQVSLMPVEILKASLKSHETNHFVKFLIGLFGVEVTSDLVSKYFVGTSKKWPGSSVFWQIDTQGRIHGGKIMLFNPYTGRRVKEPYDHITWVHTVVGLSEFELQQRFFGEHLLQDKSKPIAIVEAEKTAIIASVYLPQFIWLAVGGLNGLNAEKCQVLKGRTVTLFPDLKGFDKWNNKASELSTHVKFIVSDLLEQKATDLERKQDLDLADYLIRFDYKDFIPPEPEPTTTTNATEVSTLIREMPVSKAIHISEKAKTILPDINWDEDIASLEEYYSNRVLPNQPFKLNPYTKILDISVFIQSHLEFVKANNGNLTYLPYLKRLQELKNYLTINMN